MTEFDSMKALSEEIQGLAGVATTLKAQTLKAHMHASEAATQHDALCKLTAFAEAELARKRGVLQQLIADQQLGYTK